MSGGSWDYVYHHLESASIRLLADPSPLRRALGQRLSLFAQAMHDVEWVDSNDMGEGDDHEAIKKALGPAWPLDTLQAAITEAECSLEKLKEAITEAKKLGEGEK